jgi:hypothetical protein
MKMPTLLTAALIAILGILLVWVIFPGPAVIDIHESQAELYFFASRSAILWPGECVELRWNAGNIRSVHINGQGQIGSGEMDMCLSGDSLPTMAIKFQDESEKTYRLNVDILSRSPLFVALGIAALGLTVALLVRAIGKGEGVAFPSVTALRPYSAIVIFGAFGFVVYLALQQFPELIDSISTRRWSRAAPALETALGLVSVVAFCALIAGMKITKESPVGARRVTEGNARPSPLHGWITGFAAALVVVVGITLYVNPRGMYFSNRYESQLLLVRGPKTDQYAALGATPDLVILGSSRGFNLSPAYIHDQFGYSAYNMAVEGGRIEDILVLTRYMLNQHDGRLPKVLLVEVQPGLPREANDIAERAPFSWFRYLRPQTLQLAFQRRLETLFSVQQFAEALYVLRYYTNIKRNERTWTFPMDDGTGSRRAVDASELQYNIEIDMGNIPPLECEGVDPLSQQEAETFVTLAGEQNTAVIFYSSPWHPQYYDALLRDNPEYQRCMAAFNDYMEALTSRHDIVFFLDYSLLESINGDATEAGYYDSDHLTPLNSRYLLNAAADTIRQAYEYATQRRAENT